MHTYTHTYIRTYIRKYIHTHIHTYIHTYTHTHTHTHTYKITAIFWKFLTPFSRYKYLLYPEDRIVCSFEMLVRIYWTTRRRYATDVRAPISQYFLIHLASWPNKASGRPWRTERYAAIFCVWRPQGCSGSRAKGTGFW